MTSLELVVESPDGRLRTQRFGEREPVWLGRDPSCQLVLDSELVSRRHACVERVGEALHLRDQSVNGTEVDGAVLHHAQLRVGSRCRMRIGPYRVLAREGSDDAQLPPGQAPQVVCPYGLITPVLRVLVSILAFGIERDWRYVGITTLVFVILLVSLLLGKVGA